MNREYILLVFASCLVITASISRITVSGSLVNICSIPSYGTVHDSNSLALAGTVHNLDSGLNYSTIQEAIDSNETYEGHTIFVEAGIYYENVILNKNHLKLVGENRSTTVIDGNSTTYPPKLTLIIDADNVTVKEFTLQGGTYGVNIQHGNNNTLMDNIIIRNGCGVEAVTNNNLMTNNTVTNNSIGISLKGDSNIIINNTMSSNSTNIQVSNSNNSKIEDNRLTNGNGIIVHGSFSSTEPVYNNNTISRNSIVDCRQGITLSRQTAGNRIVENKVTNCEQGIDVSGWGNNTISDNTMQNCTSGISLNSRLNTLRNNTMINNEYNLAVADHINDIDTSNMVNGKPVYYLINRSDLILAPSTCGQIGYLGLINCSNIVVQNLTIKHNGEGILMYGGGNNTINSNTITDNIVGIYLENRYNNNVGHNITDNIISNNGNGVHLYLNNHTYIARNRITNNTIQNMPLSNGRPYFPWSSFWWNLMDASGGLLLYYSYCNLIVDNLVVNNEHGIILARAGENMLRDNNMTGNKYNFGIHPLYYGGSVTHYIQDIDTSNKVDGRPIYYWVNKQNQQVPQDAGYVAIVNSTNITIENLNPTRNVQGIFLMCSTNTLISDNVITGTRYAIDIRSELIPIPQDELLYSINTTIDNNVVTYNGAGIHLLGFKNKISHNTIQQNGDGAGICTTGTENKIHDNTVSNNTYGIYSDGSNNTILRNAIINNTYLPPYPSPHSAPGPYNNYPPGAGIIIQDSNSTIVGNTIMNHHMGMHVGCMVTAPGGNRIYHNNFIDNTNQLQYSSLNIWDNGYPSGGNYWSNYNGTDLYNGVHQDENGSDGIGDISYHVLMPTPNTPIEVRNQYDNYPLMGLFSDYTLTSELQVQTICNSTISAFRFNGTAILFNITGVEDTSGFCRICIPRALMDDTFRIYVNGTEILPVPEPLPCSNTTHTYLYFNYTHSTQEVIIVPEFPSLAILPISMMATLIAVILHRRRHNP